MPLTRRNFSSFMDKRFKQINKALISFSLGNFDARLRMSGKLDEVDAFIAGINMLGEELKAITISRDYFTNIYDSVSDMIFVINNKGIIQSINRRASEKLLSPQRTVIGQHLDTILAEKQPSLFAIMRQIVKPFKVIKETETSILLSDATTIPVACTGVFLFDKADLRIGYIITARDLTSIKKIEYSLQQSEEKYRRLFEKSGDSVFIIDNTGDMVDLNDAGTKLFGMEANRHHINLFHLFYDKRELSQFIQHLTANNQVANFKCRFKNLKGDLIECLISANVLLNNSNKIIGYQGIIKDITQQMETEKLIIRTIVDTEEKERIRFATDLHDSIGQQLSAIKFNMGAAVNSLNEGKEKLLLRKSGEQLINVLADLRNICFNLMPKTLENYGLADATRELCRQIKLPGNLRFRLRIQKEFILPDKHMEVALYRIIQEFINNSLKHSHASIITIELKKKRKAYSIYLEDNGVGFVMANAVEKTGLGLRNVQSRIRSFDGEVEMESAPGKGTKFQITVPYS
jgi:PAS domain S-box-containing protein